MATSAEQIAWTARLADAGYVAIHRPPEYGGRGADRRLVSLSLLYGDVGHHLERLAEIVFGPEGRS